MATGQIKRLAKDRGFGFIRPDGESEDIFFHTSAVQGGGFDNLSEGQTVEFDKGRRRPRPAQEPRPQRPPRELGSPKRKANGPGVMLRAVCLVLGEPGVPTPDLVARAARRRPTGKHRS